VLPLEEDRGMKNIKNAFFFFLLSLSLSLWAQRAEPFLLVTDIDDTIKITNIPHPVLALKNALFSTKAFTGMSELYTEMSKNSTDAGGPMKPFYVLTGGPAILKPRIKAFLVKNDFPPYMKIKTRNPLKEKTFDYKLRMIKELIQDSAVPLILVGDDSEFDADVFAKIKESSPEKVLAIYVRQTVGKTLPKSVTPFYHTFEVAMSEHLAGRLSEAHAILVGKSILNENNSKRIMPKFVKCPKISENLAGELEEVTRLVNDKIKNICANRGNLSK